MVKQDILFIVNPNSGRERNKSSLLSCIDLYLDKEKFKPIIEFTQRPNHATELVNEYLGRGFKEFVAVGGDGTINEIAKELLYKEAVLSIISKGSGNGLARHLGIFEKDEACIKRINKGEVKDIDAGSINNIPFLCTAGMGFDAYNAEVFSRTSGRGLRNYIKVGLLSYLRFKPILLTFENKRYSVFSLSLGNASQFGNNAYITPRAEIDNGFLDCCIVNEHPKADSLLLMKQLFNKEIDKSKYVDYFRNRSFEIKTEKPALIHYDGESMQLDTTEIKVKVLAKALKIRI